MPGKVVSISHMIDVANRERSKGGKIVTTNGCFDILTPGHVRYLEEAKSHGDLLLILMNSDVSVKKLKGEDRPVFNEESRAEMLAGLASVDYIALFDDLSPGDILIQIMPHMHVKGGDYSVETVVERRAVESVGGRILIVPKVESESTTSIIEKIKKLK